MPEDVRRRWAISRLSGPNWYMVPKDVAQEYAPYLYELLSAVSSKSYYFTNEHFRALMARFKPEHIPVMIEEYQIQKMEYEMSNL